MQEFCQSCGIPLTRDICSTEANGRLSENYCRGCYVNGEFTDPDMTIDGMIAYWVPAFLAQGYTEAEAREFMHERFPALLRWRETGLDDTSGQTAAADETKGSPVLRPVPSPNPFLAQSLYRLPSRSKSTGKMDSPATYKPFQPFRLETDEEPVETGFDAPPALPDIFDADQDWPGTSIDFDTPPDAAVQETAPAAPVPEENEQLALELNLVEPGIESEEPLKIPAAVPSDEQSGAAESDEADNGEASSGTPESADEKQHIGRRIVAFAGTLLIIASVLTILSPFWISYYERFNPFSNVEEKPDLPVMHVDEKDQDQSYPRLPAGAAGQLEIPKLGLVLNVAYGVDPEVLEQSPGFYPQSGIPERGNVSIAGHRNMSGSPFMDLNEMAKGDVITLGYQGKVYSYAVDSVFITNDRDWSVIEPTPVPALTLTTCDPVIRPADGKYNRLIVRAYLKSTSDQKP